MSGWEFGICEFQLLDTGCINSKILLCSTRNYIQYPVINHKGKEYEKDTCINVYIYIYVNIYTLLCSRN